MRKIRIAVVAVFLLSAIAYGWLTLFADRGKDTTPPTILGHEFAGLVEQVGPGVRSVKVGDRVKTGDKLISFDLDKIRAAGHPTITAFLVTDPGSSHVEFLTGIDAEAGKTTVMKYE